MSTTPESAPSGEEMTRGHEAKATVARNTALLVGGQIVGMPLTLVLNAIMARKLGPEEFGDIYLAGTLVAFGFLAVEWGQAGTLPAMIARDRSRAGALLGSGLAWRYAAAVVVYGLLAGAAALLGYGPRLQATLALVVLARIVGTTCAAYIDSARGFENSAIAAASQVRYNVLCAGLMIPALLLGGRLMTVLVVLIVADSVNTFLCSRSIRALNFGKLTVRRDDIREQLAAGTSFMLLGLALTLQPNIDAVLLSKLGTPAAMGWNAAARKLVGLLVFPVGAIASALYPTLCRLHTENAESFRKMLNTTLRTSVLLVVPVSLGTGLYAELGIQIFSKELFRPAIDNLRVLSAFIFFLYFTMILGSALAAAGKQRAWTMTQFACVFVSAVADPLLIPWFEKRVGNGGLGVCVASVISEALMVTFGFWLAPRGVIDRPLLRGLGAALLAGAGMAAVALVAAHYHVNPFVSAPLAVLGYGLCLWGLGELDRERLEVMRSIIRRRAPG